MNVWIPLPDYEARPEGSSRDMHYFRDAAESGIVLERRNRGLTVAQAYWN